MDTRYWHSTPGTFVNMRTGQIVNLPSTLSFTGDEQEWWETWWETCIDIVGVSNHTKMRLQADPQFMRWIDGCVCRNKNIIDFIDGMGQTVSVFVDNDRVGRVVIL